MDYYQPRGIIAAGTTGVKIVNVISAPALNNTFCTVLSWDAGQKRYHVRCEHDGSTIALSPEKLQVPADYVQPPAPKFDLGAFLSRNFVALIPVYGLMALTVFTLILIYAPR